MKILGIESSSLVASLAICDEGVILGEYTLNHKKTHSQTLLPMLDTLVKALDMKIDEIDAIAVSGGPGSFTGLRIGVATAKGIGMGIDKPLIHIPTLEATAYNMWGSSSYICPIMDARRQQVYTGVYRCKDSVDAVMKDTAMSIDALINYLDGLDGEIILLGDGVPVFKTYIDTYMKASHSYAPAHMNRQRAGAVAALGEMYYREGRTVPVDEMAPIYLRKSQAEREREGREEV